MANPAQTVKDRFGDKNKLVDALKPFLSADLWVGRENKDKGLARVSNAKLLRLFETFTAVQSKWGTRGKLVDAILDLEGRQKDAGFKATIETWPVPRLYDRWKGAARRANVKGTISHAKTEKKGAEGSKAEKPAAHAAAPKAAKTTAAKKSASSTDKGEKKPAKKAAAKKK